MEQLDKISELLHGEVLLGLRIKVERQSCAVHPDTGLTMRVYSCYSASTEETAFQSDWDLMAFKMEVTVLKKD